MTYNNKDGIVRTKKGDKGIYITYLNYNEYKKKERALKTCLTRTYKELYFKTAIELKNNKKPNGEYQLELYTDDLFKKVYGAITLHYDVKDNEIILKDITPGEILINLYSVIPSSYKGVPYTNKKEYLKILLKIGERI